MLGKKMLNKNEDKYLKKKEIIKVKIFLNHFNK